MSGKEEQPKLDMLCSCLKNRRWSSKPYFLSLLDNNNKYLGTLCFEGTTTTLFVRHGNILELLAELTTFKCFNCNRLYQLPMLPFFDFYSLVRQLYEEKRYICF